MTEYRGKRIARPISDGDILYWLCAFVGAQALCMTSLVWAVEHMKSHINLTSPTADLVILTLCCAACYLVAMMPSFLIAMILGPVAWYYGSDHTRPRTRTGSKFRTSRKT